MANLGPILSTLLDRYDLSSLKNWASDALIRGLSEDEIVLEMYERPEFKTRFPAIEARNKAGLAPVSVEEYLGYEAQTRAWAKQAGFTLTQDEINKMIAGDVSAQEAADRIDVASRAAFMTDDQTRNELQRLYGISGGDLVRYWLNPKEEMPKLQRRFVTAQISGESIRSGYDHQLDENQLGYLYGRGMTGEQASKSFGDLVERAELFEATDVTEEDIGVDDQLKLITGDIDQAGVVAKRGERRAAAFQGGGGFSTGKTGVSGLGSANK